MATDFGDVVLAVPTSVDYARYSTEAADWYFARCLKALLEGSGLRAADIDGLIASSFSLPPNPVASLSYSLGLGLTWLDAVPFGGASAVMAVRRAARAVQAGDAHIVACIGADTNARNSFKDLVSAFAVASSDAVYPYGAAGPTMPFAHVTQQYMDATGTRREDFGRLCVSQRYNAQHCEHALLRTPTTLEEYLQAPPVAGPLHKLDLVMPCAGAEGFLVMREARARELGLRFARLRAVVERHNAYPDETVMLRGGWAQDAARLYDMAGTSPGHIDVVATYDDCPAVMFMQLEGLGFCGQGEARHFVQEHDLRFDGDFPHNTSGGQLGCGQAGCAGGFIGVVEVLRQVTHQAGVRQVVDAQLGLASGYGMIVFDRCLGSGAVILEGV